MVRGGEHLEEIVGSNPENGPFSITFLPSGSSAENVLKYNYLSAYTPSPEVGQDTVEYNLGNRNRVTFWR